MMPRLSTRIARRAVDLLVIGWLVAVGVTTGRQFHDWWRADDAPTPLAPVDSGEDWMSRPLDIAIGPDGVQMHREPFSGSREEVIQRLSELLQSACREAPYPTAPPDDAERGLLQAINEPTEPASTGPQTHVLATPMPAVALTRRTELGTRLIGQGFAMPAGERLWTLFILPRGETAPSSPHVPPSMTVLLSWSDPQGNAVCAVHGDGRIAAALDDFDQFYGREHVALRRNDADGATVRYQSNRQTVDVRLQPDGQRGWHGVIWKEPRTK